MSQTTSTTRKTPVWPTWVFIVTTLVGCGFVLAAFAWSLERQVTGGALQLLGITLAATAVTVVRPLLKRVATTAGETKNAIIRLVENILYRFRGIQLADPADSHPAGEFPGVHMARVPPAHTSTDELLKQLIALLGELKSDVEVLGKQLEANLVSERIATEAALEAQRDELRAEIETATRQGWQLILAGLLWSAVGTAIGMSA